MEKRKRAYDILSVQLQALCQQATALTNGAAREQINDYWQQMQRILEKHLRTDEPPQYLSEKK